MFIEISIGLLCLEVLVVLVVGWVAIQKEETVSPPSHIAVDY